MRDSGFEFEINPDAKCVFVKHYGVYSLKWINKRVSEVRSHPLFKEGMNRITDVTTCEIDLSSEDMRRILSRINDEQAIRGSYREGILVHSPLQHGLGRMFDALSPMTEIQFRVFNKTEKNCFKTVKEWLYLPPDFDFPGFMEHK